MNTPDFKVIGSVPIGKWVNAHPRRIFELVRDAYVSYAQGHAVNPDSYFLRFPNDASNRIIALPASIECGDPVAGIIWIASFPDNIQSGLDRASAVFILNDRRTGYPLACLEGSLISAARTAASAVVGAHFLHPGKGHVNRLCIVGCGLIALNIVDLFHRLGWTIGAASLVDTNTGRAQAFAGKLNDWGIACDIERGNDAIGRSDMVLFATSAGTPHIHDTRLFAHCPTVLHMSLRDLSPAIILMSQNVVDDVDHCLKANTSLHLTERQTGGRTFIAGNIAQLITARIDPDFDRPRLFSPFGMGMLDLVVAQAILKSVEHDDTQSFPGFFPVPYADHASRDSALSTHRSV